MNNSMRLIFMAIGWMAPPLLILWRRPSEPKWAVGLRYVVAVLVVWQVVMSVVSLDTLVRVNEAMARGDHDGVLGDTGANAVAVMIGWVPGVVYAALLGAGRRLKTGSL